MGQVSIGAYMGQIRRSTHEHRYPGRTEWVTGHGTSSSCREQSCTMGMCVYVSLEDSRVRGMNAGACRRQVKAVVM